mgnify:CR=1 FL=1
MMHSYEPFTRKAEEFGAVLILVVMDDALVLYTGIRIGNEGSVLILVLMDDALVLKEMKAGSIVRRIVLILVLMDDALVHLIYKNMKAIKLVLILVLMDDALVPGARLF